MLSKFQTDLIIDETSQVVNYSRNWHAPSIEFPKMSDSYSDNSQLPLVGRVYDQFGELQ